jgi:ADP-ribose pyrophosphatase
VRSNDYLTHDGRHLEGYYTVDRHQFVVVLAEARGKVVMIREHRAGMDRQFLCLPAGHIEPGEAPVAAAMREFQEETGFTALSGRLIGELSPQPAWLNAQAHLVYIEASDRPTERSTDGEVDEVLLLDWETAIDKARRGEINDMQSVAGLYLVRDLLGKG